MKARRYRALVMGCGLWAASLRPAASQDAIVAAPPPDLLKGEGPTIEEAQKTDWYLHFYGARGWIHGATRAETERARQILITQVPRLSEVRDSIRVGDVILGVNGVLFARHPVYQFREYAHPATLANQGLTVTMWRSGWEAPRTLRIEPRDARPDFTRGDTVDLTAEGMAADRNLGATGARGWMYEKQERAHQILVTHVDPGSPADGILRKGDVILGVGDQPFVSDARRVFGEALTRAETEEEGGKLRLLRWRNGVTESVTIRLEVLGRYSDTAPWNCEKSRRIVERACAYLERRGTPIGGELGIQALVGSLGLLATGEERYLPRVREHIETLIRRVAESGDQPPYDSYPAWSWGYANLLLTEYHLATGDSRVLPAIETFSWALARGQAMSGTWGHGMAPPDPATGALHGPLAGYGTMNQISAICWMSLLLARRCGIADPEIERAIRNKHAFLSDFIDVGSVTYGDDLPGGLHHDDNGKTSAAAVAFAVLGDRAGTDFFGRMTVASHSIREAGHTGNYWSDLWGALGAARMGVQACAAFFREDHWRFDLERRWDGSFEYQPKYGMGDGMDPVTGRQRATAEHAIPHWDTTGARLLLYCLPRRRLAITGRDILTVELSPEEVAEAVEAGRLPRDDTAWERKYDGRPVSELLRLLGHWSPVVRQQAARSLAARTDEAPPLEALRGMLKAEPRYARYGACAAARHLGPRAQPLGDDLIALTASEDRVLRNNAIQALGALDDPRAAAALFALAGRSFPDDPYEVTRRRIADALFGGAARKTSWEIARQDRAAMLDATRRMLTSMTGHCRTVIAENVVPSLSRDELKELWPQIEHAMKTPATTYNVAIHLATLRRLRDLRVREGMDLAVNYLTAMRAHGSESRVPEVLEVLRGYGAHAKSVLPGLRRAAAHFEAGEEDFPKDLSLKKAADVREFIRQLESLADADGGAPLISIAQGWK